MSKTAEPLGTRASSTFALVGGAWTLAYLFGLLGPLADVTFAVVGVSATAATIIAVRRNGPAAKWPWLLISAAQLIFVGGGAAREALGTVGNLTASRSLVPDLITLPGYVIFGVGLAGLVRLRYRGRGDKLDTVIEGAVAAFACLALAWVYLIEPLFSTGAPIAVRLVLACYPPLSVFLVAITARLSFSGERWSPAHRYLLLAMVCMLIGDVVYMFVDANLFAVPQALVDGPYLLAYVAFGANVLHPSMRDLCEPAPPDDRTPRVRLALVAVALGIPTFVYLTGQAQAHDDQLIVTGIMLALSGTAIWRFVRALRSQTRSQLRLAHQATHDRLTGLPNRHRAETDLAEALDVARSSGTTVAVLFLDLDRFKLVNDTLGHTFGDDLLVAVTSRISNAVAAGELVARIGGDEFVVVLPGADVDVAVERAEAIQLALATPVQVRDAEVYVSASTGVVVSSGGTDTAESLIGDADTAMYQAKDAGRDAIAVFDTSMRDRVAERLLLEGELRLALERNELEVWYQPILRLPRGPVVEVEALLRWTHPTLGSIPPNVFIPIAEDSGLIVVIGRWVLEQACRQTAQWRATYELAGDLGVAVNVSARQLLDSALVPVVAAALADADLPPSALTLELTESLLMENRGDAEAILEDLRRLGVSLSIDDFGTGYSSFAYLKRFPVDSVKIDRAFVEGLDRSDSSDESLVAAMVAMTDALSLSTVAEGVETRSQHERLVELCCDRAQGYLYSRPVPADKVPSTLVRLRRGMERTDGEAPRETVVDVQSGLLTTASSPTDSKTSR